MYIKKVIIRGFKSYAAQLEFEEFHSGANVIVGANGAAIRFVLGADEFQKMRSEQRSRLLHTGTGDVVLAGYVEVHFDNSDKRLPVDNTEVVLRRTIGLKKDDYYLNNKHITADDVANLLEGAGFSRSNPYYMVMQNQVQQLAYMNPAQRYEVLKAVAGTHVYDERRAESVKIMKDSQAKQEKITEVLEMLNGRLGELENEKEELAQYKELDRDRRALEYTIHETERTEALRKLEELEGTRSTEAEAAQEVHNQVTAAHEKLKNTEKELKTVQADIQKLNKDLEHLQEERQVFVASKAHAELDLRDITERSTSSTTKAKSLQTELDGLKKQITATQKELDKSNPDFKEAQELEQELRGKLADLERKQKGLHDKLGRSRVFKSKKDRDTFLNSEIDAINETIKSKEAQRKALAGEVVVLKTKMQAQRDLVNSAGAKLVAEKKKQLDETTKEYEERRVKRDELTEEKKQHWKHQNDLEQLLQQYTNESARVERHLQSKINKDLANGLVAVIRIVREKKITGVYGPLIELFTCQPEYITAIEVTGGNALFHVVVDTDDTAAKLLHELNQEKSGRVTFIPLNKIVPRPAMALTSDTVRPLTDYMEYDTKVEKAFQQVFGKTLLCATLDTASNMARLHKVNCVSIEGDQVNSKGALTGGFVDTYSSRLKCMKDLKDIQANIRRDKDDLKKTQAKIETVEQTIAHITHEMTRIDKQRVEAKDAYERTAEQVRTAAKDLLMSEQLLQQKEAALADIETSIPQLKDSAQSLKAEMKQELLHQLNDTEQAALRKIDAELPAVQKEWLKASEAHAEQERHKQELENRLTTNLLRRKEELERQISSAQQSEEPAQVSTLQSDVDRVNRDLEEVTAKKKAVDTEIEQKKAKAEELKKSIDKIQREAAETAKQFQEDSRSMEKLLTRRNTLLQKKEEMERKIRDIGPLPEAVDKFRDQSVNQCTIRLQQVLVDLKRFPHVNKKAMDQYVSFSEQRDSLEKRKKELDDSELAIAELIETLDAQKKEAIERTLRGVAKHFAATFAQLSGNGVASLVRERGEDGETKAIDIQVAFNGATDHIQKLGQLSGGQRSLVALSLIFAIQKVDDLPFYIFDEVDPALDSHYRTAVARMIHQQVTDHKQQFIIVTHRSEIVEQANKHYNITYTNRVSNIVHVEKEDALEIVQANAEAELENKDED